MFCWLNDLASTGIRRVPPRATFSWGYVERAEIRFRGSAPTPHGGYPRKVFSGGGLYLYLTPSGGKYWRYKYRYAGKEKMLSLGAYPDVPFESARARHLLARQLLEAGVDPASRRN